MAELSAFLRVDFYLLLHLADQRITMLIKIKFLAPTNYKGSRYKATVKDGDNFQFSATVPSTYTSGTGDALAAAEEVSEKVRQLGATNVKGYDVQIVGAYDGDLFATMSPFYND